MTNASRALLEAIQRRKPAKDILCLISKESAKTADIFYNLKPLFWALSYGSPLEVIEALLAEHPDAINEKHPVEGWTPLHYVEKLDAATVKCLIARCPGAAKVKDHNGQLPLHWAAEHDAPVEVVQMLLQANEAAPFERDNLGRLPIKLALDSDAGQELIDLLKAANPAGAGELRRAPLLEPLPVAMIFPGQGSQYVGMLKEVAELPAVQEMLAEAKQLLGYDLLEVCLEGPDDKLQDTVYCQPAMYVAGLAALEKLRLERPEVVERPRAVAGLSLGEYTALTAAGVFTFADGLKLVQARAEAMQHAANLRPQSMLSIAGLPEEQVLKLCEEAREKVQGEDEVCQISNYLFQKGYAVGGTKAAVEACRVLAEDAKALQARLIKASGGFHTALMEPARARLKERLDELLPRMSRPRCKVFMNVDAQPIGAETEPSRILELLTLQLTNPVRWKDVVESMTQDGVQEFYECGPMKQLKAMMKRIDNTAWSKTSNVEV